MDVPLSGPASSLGEMAPRVRGSVSPPRQGEERRCRGHVLLPTVVRPPHVLTYTGAGPLARVLRRALTRAGRPRPVAVEPMDDAPSKSRIH